MGSHSEARDRGRRRNHRGEGRLRVTRRLLCAFGAAAAASALLAAGAGASTISRTAEVFGTASLNYTAGSHEVNDLVIEASGDGWTFEDTGATIATTAEGCSTISAHLVDCESTISNVGAATVADFDIDLGDEDDSFDTDTGISVPMYVHGGAGSDTIRSAAGADFLAGGAGDDTLEGRGAGDSLLGGIGDDRLDGDSGNDTLAGGPGEDSLFGEEGNDRLDGGGDRDYLQGEEGVDTLIAGGDGVVDEAADCGSDPGDVAILGAEDVAGDTLTEGTCETHEQDPNLLADGGAESSIGGISKSDIHPPVGWTTAAGQPTAIEYGGEGRHSPFIAGPGEAGANVESGYGYGNGIAGGVVPDPAQAFASSVYQDVGVAGDATEIDKHFEVATVAADIGGDPLDGPEHARVEVATFDGSSQQLGTTTALSREGGFSFKQHHSAEIRLPVGTRRIRVTLSFEHHAGDHEFDGAFVDNVSLAVARKPPEAAVSTQAATDVATTSATLHGTVNPNESAATYDFEWGTTGFTHSTAVENLPSGTSAVPVSAALTNLQAATTYRVRLAATNAGGTAHGEEVTFTTPAADSGHGNLPIIVIEEESDVKSHEVTLHGSVSAQGQQTTYQFEYGLTKAYGSSTMLRSTSGFVQAVETATGLEAGRSYHYRLVARNAAGTAESGDETFKTLAGPSRPQLVPNTPVSVSSVTAFGAAIQAAVQSSGAGGHQYPVPFQVEYGVDKSYGQTSAKSSSVPNTVLDQVTLKSLTPSTIYHFRIVAENSDGTLESSDHILITSNSLIAQTIQITTKEATVPVHCVVDQACAGSLSLETLGGGAKSSAAGTGKAHPVLLGRVHFSVPAHRSGKVKVPFTAAGRRAVRHGHKLAGTVVTTFKGPGGKSSTATQSVTLKRG